MSGEAECEIARDGGPAVTPGDRSGARRAAPPTVPPAGLRTATTLGGTLRTTLRAADGVRIEAAYVPFRPYGTEGAGAEAPHAGAGEGEPHTGAGDAAGPGYAFVLAHGFTGALDRPALRRAAETLARHAPVVTFSFRGHGRSGGHSTVGDREVLDLAAAVRWARSLGHPQVATVGFSMGGSVVLRHGALYRPEGCGEDRGEGCAESRAEDRPRCRSGRAGPGDDAEITGTGDGEYAPGVVMHGERTGARTGTAAHADAAVAVSAPARWYYRGTAPMRRLHWVVQRPVGRLVSRYGLRTRIHPRDWAPVPLSPVAAAPLIAPTPLLVVHGDRDPYFPLDHPRSLLAAAGPEGAELWIEPGFGHAENAAEPALLHRIGAWAGARCREAGGARHHGTRNADG